MKIFRRTLGLSVGPLIATLLFGAPPAEACNVPVFRYALEFWPASPYEIVAVHSGPLSNAEQLALAELDKAALNESAFNIAVKALDLQGEPSPELEKLWVFAEKPAPPCLIAFYPRDEGIPFPIWSAPLTADNVASLLDSPARQEIASQILEGQSVVWVFLEGTDAALSAEARSALEASVAQLGQTIHLPADPDDDFSLIETSSIPLKIGFSIVAISNGDERESFFRETLLGSEPGLRDLTAQPMAFPVYGRGRALYALVGKGIYDANIREACQFLAGPCSCQVKSLNEGTDLLMAADWASHLKGSSIRPIEPPPLVGLSTLAEAADSAAEAIVPESMPATPGAAKPESRKMSSRLYIVLAGIVGAVVALTLIITMALPKER
jgi:hypothetical protein